MTRALLALILALLLTACAAPALPPQVTTTAVLPPADMPEGLCTTFRHQYLEESAWETAELLEFPCHHNWIQDGYGVPNHTPTVYSMRLSALDGYIEQHTDGEFTFVGSEGNINATHIDPTEAAEFSRQWAAQTDAPWACCGTLHTNDRPQLYGWLDDYLAADGEVPTAWSLHIYFTPLNANWDAALNQFRQWMQDNDAERPIIVSETAQTSNLPPDILLRHVNEAQAAQDDLLAIFWYPADRDAYGFAPQSELTRDGKLTPLGEVFVALTQVAGQGEEPETLRMWLPMVRR